MNDKNIRVTLEDLYRIRSLHIRWFKHMFYRAFLNKQKNK